MIKAFVFGKFLPFHKGHEAMIRFALEKCDFLAVLVCCSDKESIPGTVRSSWIKKTFEANSHIEVITFNYLESELPNTSESSETISKAWADVFKKILPGYSLLVTSEPYGDFVARYMNIRHMVFDADKKQYPFSASVIREDLFTNWNYMPDSVKQYFALKVVILGTESTGKTTLSHCLADHYKCSCVSEAGRELIANSNSFVYKDLVNVAEVHAARVQQAVIGHSPLVIIDTDVHITMSYSRFTFNRELEVAPEVYTANKSGLYLYLNNDVEFVQDGTRLSEADRNRLDISHRQILMAHGIECIEIKGDWESRFTKAIKHINEFIEVRKIKHRVE